MSEVSFRVQHPHDVVAVSRAVGFGNVGGVESCNDGIFVLDPEEDSA